MNCLQIGNYINMARQNRKSLWFKQFIKNINPRRKNWQYGLIACLADIALLLILGITFYSCVWLRKAIYEKTSFAYIITCLVFLVLCFFLTICFVIACGASWNKDYSFQIIIAFSLHFAYIVCMSLSFLDFADEFIKAPIDLMASDVAVSYMCLVFLVLVEMTALAFYAIDVYRGWEGDPPSRWWIRTTPYAAMGLIFLFVNSVLKTRSCGGNGYSMFYSVATSVLAINYLLQIINERIVPKAGPYKDTAHHNCSKDDTDGCRLAIKE